MKQNRIITIERRLPITS